MKPIWFDAKKLGYTCYEKSDFYIGSAFYVPQSLTEECSDDLVKNSGFGVGGFKELYIISNSIEFIEVLAVYPSNFYLRWGFTNQTIIFNKLTEWLTKNGDKHENNMV